jgi:hypothetical protein
MKFLQKLFNYVGAEERKGASLDFTASCWEIEGPRTFQDLFHALQGWLEEEAFLYFEGGSPDADLLSFLSTHSVPEQLHLAMGTILPRPRIFHLPARPGLLQVLSRLMETRAEPELAIHFHVYKGDGVLLEWYDAFDLPMRLRGDLPEARVRLLAERLGKAYRRVEPGFTPGKKPT